MFDMCLLNGLNGVHDTYVHDITNKLFCFGCFKRPIYDAREIEILQCHIHIVKIGMVQNLGARSGKLVILWCSKPSILSVDVRTKILIIAGCHRT